jgi:hypothetical protein
MTEPVGATKVLLELVVLVELVVLTAAADVGADDAADVGADVETCETRVPVRP